MGRPNVNVNVYGNKSGMTKTYSTVVLRQTKTVAEQLVDSNTIYEIRYDFDLGGESVTVPENCVLDFRGGSFTNGEIVGQETKVLANSIVLKDVVVGGSYANTTVHSMWVKNATDTETLRAVFNLCNGNTSTSLSVQYGDYTIIADGGRDAVPGSKYNYNDIGLMVPSNTAVDFNNSVLRVNPTQYNLYVCLNIFNKENVRLSNLTIIGDVDSHLGTGGEWGYNIFIAGSKNVVIENVVSDKSWGDGIATSLAHIDDNTRLNNENVLISNCVFDDNRRQGLSLMAGINIRIFNSLFTNTGKTAYTSPGCGIDIEPNYYEDEIVDNVVIDSCELTGGVRGLQIIDVKTAESRIKNVVCKNTTLSALGINAHSDTAVDITGCTIDGGALSIGGSSTKLYNCRILWQINCQAFKSAFETTAVFISCYIEPKGFYNNAVYSYFLVYGTNESPSLDFSFIDCTFIHPRGNRPFNTHYWSDADVQTAAQKMDKIPDTYKFNYIGCNFVAASTSVASTFNILFSDRFENCICHRVGKLISHRTQDNPSIYIQGCNLGAMSTIPHLLEIQGYTSKSSADRDISFINNMIYIGASSTLLVSIGDDATKPKLCYYNNVFTGKNYSQSEFDNFSVLRSSGGSLGTTYRIATLASKVVGAEEGNLCFETNTGLLKKYHNGTWID